MLVYGDIERTEDAADVRAAVAESLRACERQPPGLERHATLVDAFIRTGELVQGLLDAEFEALGADHLSEVQETSGRLLLALAQAVGQSWEDGFRGDLILPSDWEGLLERLDLAGTIRIKRAEGFAFYTLYPESYFEAARRSGLSSRTIVVGIRSIGTGLAAMVAAGLGAQPAVTVRPIGHPFDRRVEISPALAEKIMADTKADIAIVDEGPGLSGSSLGGVADWLEMQGVRRENLHFFPSHPGELGRESVPRHRQRWAERPRHVVSFEELAIRTPAKAHKLEAWIASLVGPLDAPLQCLSGGDWRAIRYNDDEHWPPSDMQFERIKFLARAGGKAWLVKFAGIGEEGTRKLRKGRVLAEAGYTPEITGLCHGFLVERWVEGTPLNQAGVDRGRLVEGIGRYLGFRARNLRAAHNGASVSELFAMATFNVGKSLGARASSRVKILLGDPRRFDGAKSVVDTDNRLHAWEWLITDSGKIVKTDALDHSAAHDLVGCQDIAWDVAGASVEFAFSPQERARLASVISRAGGCEINAELLAVLEPCYVAFQIGLWTHAAANSAKTESSRIEKTLKNYTHRLESLLSATAV